jgi:poly-gamma-glutamate capsule biosynthesis protein CapA/YwtB (metallophosphatase superfamily)
VDFVLVSYHGGAEYADTPSREVRTFARNALENGVDLFLGHHPHVPYGYEGRGDRLAFHSLGNFVFRQPQRMWTQYGVAVSATLIKDAAGSRIAGVRCLPVRAGFQPVFLGPGEEASRVLERVRRLTTPIDRELTSW